MVMFLVIKKKICQESVFSDIRKQDDRQAILDEE